MRAPILGVAIDDLGVLRTHVRVSTRLTHTDPQAEHGAIAIALAARLARRQTGADNFLTEVTPHLDVKTGRPLLERLTLAVESAGRGETTRDFADRLGLSRGVTGYINHTVPAAIHAWLRHPLDLSAAIQEMIACGGDTDSTAALVGGLVGTTIGPGGIPVRWLDMLAEHPRSVAWMTQLAVALDGALATNTPQTPPTLPALPLLARNTLFAGVVLVHGLYRLRPW